ncbi:MAG TPA: methyltransferase [Chitinophagales bacterium]|nr:methyltransferase [Chitinophagales bacterium]
MKSELKSMFTEHWKYLAVSTACKLNLFDKIHEGQNTLNKLVECNLWNGNTLSHLLNFLFITGFLEVDDDRTYHLNESANLLRQNNIDGLYYACLNWSAEHLTAWQHLDHSIKTGESSFKYLYKNNFFNYLSKHPEKLINYHKAMYQYALDDYKELPDAVDFSVHQSIMDVGGGYGAAISLIKERYVNANCYLFDMEAVVHGIFLNQIHKVAGDFFNYIPPIADAIILARVIHDWNDMEAQKILCNCYNALPDRGILYLIENCSDKTCLDLSLLSLNMIAMCQSYERSSIEYIRLCHKAGFTYLYSKPLNQLQTILIFQK